MENATWSAPKFCGNLQLCLGRSWEVPEPWGGWGSTPTLDQIWGQNLGSSQKPQLGEEQGSERSWCTEPFFPKKWGNHRIIWAGKNLKSIEFQAHLALYCPREKEIKIGGYSPWESHLFWGSEQFIWGKETWRASGQAAAAVGIWVLRLCHFISGFHFCFVLVVCFCFFFCFHLESGLKHERVGYFGVV